MRTEYTSIPESYCPWKCDSEVLVNIIKKIYNSLCWLISAEVQCGFTFVLPKANIPTCLYLLVMLTKCNSSLEKKNYVRWGFMQNVAVCEYVGVTADWGETASPGMWKEYKTISALLRESSSGKQLPSGAAQSQQWSALGCEQINVRCITYHEQAQVLHLTDTRDTLDIHNGHKSREGHPAIERVYCLSSGLQSGSSLPALFSFGIH